jgi:hypothetical protein
MFGDLNMFSSAHRRLWGGQPLSLYISDYVGPSWLPVVSIVVYLVSKHGRSNEERWWSLLTIGSIHVNTNEGILRVVEYSKSAVETSPRARLQGVPHLFGIIQFQRSTLVPSHL